MVVLFSLVVVCLVVVFYVEDCIKEDADTDNRLLMQEERQWNSQHRVILKGLFRQHNESFKKYGPKGTA